MNMRGRRLWRVPTGILVRVSVDYRPAYPDATASPGPPRGPARKDDPYAARPATPKDDGPPHLNWAIV